LATGAAGEHLESTPQTQARVEPGLFRIPTYPPDAPMQLDAAPVRNLELPALLQLVARTCTPIGARRLRRWIWAPLRDAEAIEMRLGAVSELSKGGRTALRTALGEVGDLERLVGRAARGLASPRELVALRRSLEAVPAVSAAGATAASLLLRQLAAAIKPDPTLADELARALAEDPPAVMRDGGAIRPAYDAELDRIQEASRAAREWISSLE